MCKGLNVIFLIYHFISQDSQDSIILFPSTLYIFKDLTVACYKLKISAVLNLFVRANRRNCCGDTHTVFSNKNRAYLRKLQNIYIHFAKVSYRYLQEKIALRTTSVILQKQEGCRMLYIHKVTSSQLNKPNKFVHSPTDRQRRAKRLNSTPIKYEKIFDDGLIFISEII